MPHTDPDIITLKLGDADTSLQAIAGELVLLHGREGSGKSAWLKCMAGLCKPPSGIRIETEGPIRMLFDQHPPVWLGQNVGEELCFGLKHRPDSDQLAAALQQWGLSELQLTTNLKSLNRLQSIRLSMAAITLAKPSLSLLDSQTDALSTESGRILAREISNWAKCSNTTVVVACNRWHDWQPVVTQIWSVSSSEDLPQIKETI